MEILFNKLKENEKAEFHKSESQWWNGHTYLPLFDYYLNYNYLKGIIKFHYEFRQSEFTKPSLIDGGAYGDRHNFEISSVIPVTRYYSRFSISERSIFKKIFNKQSDFFFRIKCNQNEFARFLKQNKNLNEIFIISENSPEFSPLIEGKMNGENFELSINYNTQQKNESILISMNEFCKNLIEYLN